MSPDTKDNTIRFDTSLVKKLQGELTSAKEEREEIIRGSRLYWQRVQSVHQAALLLLESKGLDDALSLLQEDVARLLGFDAVALMYERLAADKTASLSALFRVFPAHMAKDDFFEHDIALIEDMGVLQILFPENAGILAFALCLPLKTGARRGVLVLGQRDAQYLSVGQALEPYVFLARVLERLAKAWHPA